MYETYHGLLKSGEIRQYEKKPKRKHVCIKTYKKTDQDTAYMLTCGENAQTFVAHCGYDRGPKLVKIIKRMLS
mgnify:CR=1 FL=1